MFNWAHLYHDIKWVGPQARIDVQTDVAFHAWLILSDHQPVYITRPDLQRGGYCVFGDYLWPTDYQAIEQQQPGNTTTHTFRLPHCTYCTYRWWMVFPAPTPDGAYSTGPIFKLHCTPALAEYWSKHVLTATYSLGVYETHDFVADESDPAGIPTWTKINTGIATAFPLVAMAIDPFNQETRWYCATQTCVYKKQPPANWTSILTQAQAMALTGSTNALESLFRLDGLACDPNYEGHIGVLFRGWRSGTTPYSAWYITSSDFGATWAAYAIRGWGSLAANCESLSIGNEAGASPYPPGQVLYCALLSGSRMRFARSLNGGVNWTWINLDLGSYACQTLVDPPSQNRCWVAARYNPAASRIGLTINHGATLTDYDLTAEAPLGTQASRQFLANAPNAISLFRSGTRLGYTKLSKTLDDGLTWTHTPAQYAITDLSIALRPDQPDKLYLKTRSSVPAIFGHSIFASDDEGTTMHLKAGTNPFLPDPGDPTSIPYNCGGHVFTFPFPP